MYTRCPACESVYELDARLLAEAAGVVRCGNCGKTFNSLGSLFHEHPQADELPISGGGMPPMLDYRAITQPDLPGVDIDEEPVPEPGPHLAFPDTTPANAAGSKWWPVAGLALAVILLAQIMLQAQYPASPVANLLDNGRAAVDLAAAGEAIQIVSRDMHRHPTLDDAIIVSASLRNPSSERLAWPVLEVRLYDPSQQILGVRRLEPSDYLQNADNVSLGMPAGQIAPVILEFVVGTTLPSGFDFRFY